MPAEKRYSNIEEDFLEAEKKVLKAGQSFDGIGETERRDFICDFENTFDVQAVPGSGKTTALLAKFVILEKNIDKLDGGVLVLSHTNKSVENIKERLGNLCPQLCNSNYHFIGTIQSFVNDFLAKPYYAMKTGNKIQDIDDDYWYYRFSRSFSSRSIASKSVLTSLAQEMAKCKCSNDRAELNKKCLLKLKDNEIIEKIGRNRIKLNESDIYGSFGNEPIFKDKTKDAYKKLFGSINEVVLSDKVLRFKDAFDFGFDYIETYPIIKLILQKRFKYIYIDEMQDLEDFQIKLIDDIFGDYSGEDYITPCIIQRIGDISQCIFHEGSENGAPTRKPRQVRSISGSHRLHQATADVVNCFKHGDTVDIIGNSREIIIKSTLLIFKKGQEEGIGKWFVEQLKEKGYEPNLSLISINKEDQKEKKRYTAVGRTGKNKTEEQTAKGENNWCLKHYFPNYSKESSTTTRKSKEYFSTLLGYINNYDPGDTGLAQIRKMVLRSIIHQIRTHDHYRMFGISDFLEHLKKSMGEDIYGTFLVNIYMWCRKIQQSQKNESILITIKNEIVEYYNEIIITYFPWATQISGEYVSDELKDKEQKKIETSDSNFMIHDGYYLNIDSVHGAKGQDHEATLYLMTNFHKSDYEYFIDIIKGDKKCSNPRHQQAQKMFYVGFSRAKKWLCYAVCKDDNRDDSCEKILEEKGRNIAYL